MPQQRVGENKQALAVEEEEEVTSREVPLVSAHHPRAGARAEHSAQEAGAGS